MDVNQQLTLLFTANQMKTLPRSGWAQRGVPAPENIAAHSFGVVVAALMLMPLIDESFDTARVLAMAALHDLPEALTTDLPSPVKRFFPDDSDGLKTYIERGAMQEITEHAPFADEWMAIFEELHASETREAKLVHDVDKLDMYLQAYQYEQQTGTRMLAPFWRQPHRFYFAEAQAIYDELATRRTHSG